METNVQSDCRAPLPSGPLREPQQGGLRVKRASPKFSRPRTKDAVIVVRVPRVFGVVLRDEARRRNVEPGDILKDPIESFLRQFVTQWSDGVAAGGALSPAQQAEAA